MGWRALHDGYCRTWHFADGGVRGPGLLRRNPRRDLGRAARRPVHRTADAHLAGRHRVRGQAVAWRHHSSHADSVLGGGVLQHGERRLQSGRAVADTGVRDDRPRPRHEQLDVGAVRVSRGADQSRQGADARKTSTAWADSRATKMWTATASAIARCRASIIRRQRGSRAAADTTRSRKYSERPDDYQNNLDRLRTSSRTRAQSFPSLRWFATTATTSASSPTARRTTRWSRRSTSCRTSMASTPITCACGPIRSRREVHDFITSHKRVYVVDQNRDGQMFNLLKLDIPAEHVVQAAQRAPLQRAADRRALRNRRHHFPGGQVNGDHSYATPTQDQPHRAYRARLSRRQDHALRRLRPQRHLRAHYRRLVRDGHSARARGEDVGHRLLVEEPGVLHEPLAQLQLRARTHAVGDDRRGAGQLNA